MAMKTCRILLIDDDAEDFLIMSEVLCANASGVEMVYANSGLKGLKILEDSLEKGNRLPDAILLDLNMPVLNGPDVMRLLKTNDKFRSLPVIIYSTAINPRDEEECRALGAHACIVKPNTLEEITEVGEMIVSMCRSNLKEAAYPPE